MMCPNLLNTLGNYTILPTTMLCGSLTILVLLLVFLLALLAGGFGLGGLGPTRLSAAS